MAVQPTYSIPTLPVAADLETREVLKALNAAHRRLAELKGRASSIPNQSVLISTLSLQEAKASSKIESIITTGDELYRSMPRSNEFTSPAAKEVHRYHEALLKGFWGMKEKQGLLPNSLIIQMFQLLKETQEEFRSAPGTVLRNDLTGEVVYVPPQSRNEILDHMRNFETYLNDSDRCDLDPLTKLAILHHQFESIHPFSDGNGRLGRLINVLFLVKEDLLDIPILYLSRFITDNKEEYYRLLQSTRDTGNWQEWLLFIITAIEQTSIETTDLIEKIKSLMSAFKTRLRDDPKLHYSQDFLNNLFKHPYTRIEYVMEEEGVSRPTATRYLNDTAKAGLLTALKIGNKKYFINSKLTDLFLEVGERA